MFFAKVQKISVYKLDFFTHKNLRAERSPDLVFKMYEIGWYLSHQGLPSTTLFSLGGEICFQVNFKNLN